MDEPSRQMLIEKALCLIRRNLNLSDTESNEDISEDSGSVAAKIEKALCLIRRNLNLSDTDSDEDISEDYRSEAAKDPIPEMSRFTSNKNSVAATTVPESIRRSNGLAEKNIFKKTDKSYQISTDSPGNKCSKSVSFSSCDEEKRRGKDKEQNRKKVRIYKRKTTAARDSHPGIQEKQKADKREKHKLLLQKVISENCQRKKKKRGPFTCKICGKAFHSNLHLEEHARIHTGVKPFMCIVCNHEFSSKSNLVSHMKVHTGEKTNKCSVCERLFSRNSYLREHLRMHEGIRPFRCAVCDKAFFTKVKLAIHMRVHTGERPYSCSVCDKSFTQNCNRKRHMKMHFKYSECDESFVHK